MPEGEHFTPEMLDRDEHPHDPKWRARAKAEQLQGLIDSLPEDVKWSVEQIRAQCGRVIAGDSRMNSESRSLAWFVQNELLDNMVPALVAALKAAASSVPPKPDTTILEQIVAIASRALAEPPALKMADTGALVEIATVAETALKARR
jgi:hypothetical protein